jgi:hypothetical protein
MKTAHLKTDTRSLKSYVEEGRKSNGIDHGKLAPLRTKVASDTPLFDLAQWRDTPKDNAYLRD